MKILYDPKMDAVITSIKQAEVWDMYEQHYHNAYEVYLVTDGDREIIINERSYILHSGDLVVIEPYVLHYTKSHESKTISRWLCNFRDESLRPVFSEKETAGILKDFRSCIIHVDNMDFISAQLERIEECFRSYEPIHRKIAISLIAQFILELKTLISSTDDILAQKNTLRKDMLLAIRYIHNNFTNTEVALQDVLDCVHMSKSRFSELFKKTTGMTYLKYLNYVRAASVRRELISGNDPIATISERNGFSEVQKMTRVFNDMYGMAPTKYRKAFRDTIMDE